jgi:hypothetical protein
MQQHGAAREENGDRSPHHEAKPSRDGAKQFASFQAEPLAPKDRGQHEREEYHPPNPTDCPKKMNPDDDRHHNGNGIMPE